MKSHSFQIQSSEVEKHVYEYNILNTFFPFTDNYCIYLYILRRSRRLCGRRQILIWILNVWEPWGHEACLFRAARQCMVDSFLGNGNVTMQQLCAAEFWFHPTEPCQGAGNPMPAATKQNNLKLYSVTSEGLVKGACGTYKFGRPVSFSVLPLRQCRAHATNPVHLWKENNNE